MTHKRANWETKRQQAAAAAKNDRMPWTPAEDEILKREWVPFDNQPGMVDHVGIAARLGRTIDGCLSRVSKLRNHPDDCTPKKAYDPDNHRLTGAPTNMKTYRGWTEADGDGHDD